MSKGGMNIKFIEAKLDEFFVIDTNGFKRSFVINWLSD